MKFSLAIVQLLLAIVNHLELLCNQYKESISFIGFMVALTLSRKWQQFAIIINIGHDTAWNDPNHCHINQHQATWCGHHFSVNEPLGDPTLHWAHERVWNSTMAGCCRSSGRWSQWFAAGAAIRCSFAQQFYEPVRFQLIQNLITIIHQSAPPKCQITGFTTTGWSNHCPSAFLVCTCLKWSHQRSVKMLSIWAVSKKKHQRKTWNPWYQAWNKWRSKICHV